MVDPRRLADLLDDYRRALLEHRERVEEGFATAQESFERIQGYDWEQAQQFRARFRRTSEAFESYTQGTQVLVQLLEERIGALRELARIRP
jgi:hypothetical protein